MRAVRTISLIALCATVVAHERPLTAKQREEFVAVRPMLKGPLRVADVRAIHDALPSFGVAELREIEHHAEYGELSEGEQAHLRQAAWAIVFVAQHGTDLRDPWPIGLLLGSAEWSDWLEGMRLLEKAEFDKGLERVAVSLVSDSRPQVRIGAGRLAKALTRFRGPSRACTAIAKRLLSDPVPNVIAMFAAYDALDFRDKEVTDLVVARLSDTRELDDRFPGAKPWPGTVAGYIGPRLYGEMLHLYGGKALGKYEGLELRRVIEKWWRENRDRYDYGLDPQEWRLVGEWTGRCKQGAEAEVRLTEGRVWFTVLDYSEGWHGERPVHSIRLRLRGEGQSLEDAAQIGASARESVERGLCGWSSDGQGCKLEYFVVPDNAGDLRTSVRVWKGSGS